MVLSCLFIIYKEFIINKLSKMKKIYISHLTQLINNHKFLLQTLEFQLNNLINNITKIDKIYKLI
jgi:hypothetical protein